MSRRASLLLLLSCGPLKPYSLDTDTGGSTIAPTDTSGPATTSNITPDTSTSSSSSTTDAPDTGDLPQVCTEQNCPPGSECVFDEDSWNTGEGLCTPTCELLSDDCPEGQKCFVHGDSWEYNHCVPLDPNPAGFGEPCTWIGPIEDHVDTCAADMICWYIEWTEWAEPPNLPNPDPIGGTGVCMPECTYAGPDVCPKDFLCLSPTMYTDIGICTPQCDPTLPSCPTGSACAFHGANEGFGKDGAFVCDDTTEATAYGSPCFGYWTCTDGHYCVGADYVPDCNAEACCTRYCDTGTPNTCPGAPLQECISLIDLWGDKPDPPGPQFAHIGLCVVP